MIVSDGYTIQEYSKQNKIVITLPQTIRTCTNTVGVIEDRKDNLSDMEQAIVLNIVKSIYQGLYK